MAHELEIIDGKAQMFSAGGVVPWHGLGTIVEDQAVTAREAIELAGLNWTVESHPAYAMVGESVVRAPKTYLNIRTSDNSVVGTVGEQYKILQNVDAFTFLDNLVDDGSAKYVTAGSLFNGRQVWMLMQMPETIRLTDSGDEDINQYIMLRNSHDGSSAVTVAVTPVRIVCNNTLTLALKEAQRTYKVRHTSTLNGRLVESRKILDLAIGYNKSIEKLGKEYLSSPVSNWEFDAFLNTLVPLDGKEKQSLTMATNRQQGIKEVYFNTPDLQNIKGTKWGVLQAVIDYNDHHIESRGTDNRLDKRMKRILDQSNLTHEAHKILQMM